MQYIGRTTYLALQGEVVDVRSAANCRIRLFYRGKRGRDEDHTEVRAPLCGLFCPEETI
jgi:hypothetical protein